jgi:hypothetical protein
VKVLHSAATVIQFLTEKSEPDEKNTIPSRNFSKTLLLGEIFIFYHFSMPKMFSKRLPLVVILLLSVLTLTGCTLFDKDKTTNQEPSVTQSEQDTVLQYVSIKVLDQNDNLIEQEVQLSEGENLYEILGKAMTSTNNLNIEFDLFEFNGETSFFITTINGYNPSDDNKFWSFKVNDELSTVGISDYMPKAEDVIKFELATIN